MLKINIPKTVLFNEQTNEFLDIPAQTIELEHSLISVSKWESKWRKAFLGKSEKTSEEMLDYIRCMTLTKNVDPNVYKCLTNQHIQEINDYISAPMTAVYFPENNSKGKPIGADTITSELMYYWMISFNVPFECQKWHLNRLYALIRVCDMKTNPKKMSKKEILARNAALNAERLKRSNGRG